MKRLSALALAFLGFACGGAASSLPSRAAAPTGVAEAQAATPQTGLAPEAPHRAPFQANVLQAARSNDAYRRVVFTGVKTQLVLMTIPAGGDIGFETHSNVEQLIFIADGQAKAILDGAESALTPGDVVVVTPGTRHDIVNTGSEPLRIYTVYAPPNHIDGRVQPTKADAEADKADEAFGQAVR
jgi:mannose-6-phosphate isomerase-like protein (cupin superfamily)